MYAENAIRFLTKDIFMPSYINNNAFSYIVKFEISFFVFTTKLLKKNAQKCDNYFAFKHALLTVMNTIKLISLKVKIKVLRSKSICYLQK
jgi:hypothetical protein